MSTRTRLGKALTAPVLLGCLVVAFSAPPVAVRSASATVALPEYSVKPGRTFKPAPPTAVLPVSGYRLTGQFGDSSGYWASVHTGVDFATSYGSPIRAITSGVVTSTAYDGAYGYKTVVQMRDGTELWFCHQSSQVAQVGQRLAPGDVIGYVGTTGNTTGPHLHLEVRPGGGDPIDPYGFLLGLRLQP